MGFKPSSMHLRFAGVVAVFLGACGGGSAPPATIDNGPGDNEMDAGMASPKDAGPKDGGAKADAAEAGSTSNPDGPILTVLSPTATDDPASEDVISASTLTVRCEAKQNPKGERVDSKSVKVSLYKPGDTKAVVSQVANSTGETDVFEAQNISLAALPHGEVRIECEASDLATKVQRSTESITTLLDQGPEITFLNPMEKGFVKAGNGLGPDVDVRFKVAPRPLADGDTGADISNIKATVGGKAIDKLTPSPTEPNVYSFTLDFADQTLFTVVPNTLSVRIDASNSRSPTPRETTASLAVGVDSQGPVITVISPARAGGMDAVVSGKVDVKLSITDALAGVNRDSVLMRIQRQDGGNDVYRADPGTGDTYVAHFETGSYPGMSSLKITLEASDNAANDTQSSLGVDIDSVPPWISLDPPKVRELYLRAAGNVCTGVFDPLGAMIPNQALGMVNDLDHVQNAFRPAALIWDRPLVIPNVITRVAMIDSTTPRFYVQHNTDTPLLVDSDHDTNHECDAINDKPATAGKEPVTLVLTMLTPTGAGPQAGTWRLVDTTYVFTEDLTTDPPVTGQCTSGQVTYPGPQPLASDTIMTRIIRHTAQGGTGVVFVDSPAPTGLLRSTGKDYETPRTGWACLVAAAKDTAGNFAFSPPQRVCFTGDPDPCTAPPPSCTDGCVIPAQFQANAPGAMPRVLTYRQ